MVRIRIDLQRRDFLKLGSFAVASVVVASRATRAGDLRRVDEKDQQAQDLGYRNDATQVDRKKFAKYEPGAMCGNCRFFQGGPGDALGACQIFSSRLVSARGWCSAYLKAV